VVHWNASRPSPSAAQLPQLSLGTAAEPVPDADGAVVVPAEEGTA
jgi:hypothetical protein